MSDEILGVLRGSDAIAVRRATLDALDRLARLYPAAPVVRAALGACAAALDDARPSADAAKLRVSAAERLPSLFRAALGLAAVAQTRSPESAGLASRAREARDLAHRLATATATAPTLRLTLVGALEALTILSLDAGAGRGPAVGGLPAARVGSDHPVLSKDASGEPVSIQSEADTLLTGLLSLAEGAFGADTEDSKRKDGNEGMEDDKGDDEPSTSAPDSSPVAVALAALSAVTVVVRRHPRAAAKAVPALGRLADRAGSRGAAGVGTGRPTRSEAAAQALRISLLCLLRSADPALAPWRPRFAGLLTRAGFAAEADREKRAAQRRDARGREREVRASAAAAARGEREDEPENREASVARVRADLVERLARSTDPSAEAATFSKGLAPAVLADLVLSLLPSLPAAPPDGGPPGQPPGLAGLIGFLNQHKAREEADRAAARGLANASGTGGATASDDVRAAEAEEEALVPLEVIEEPALAADRLTVQAAREQRDAAVARVLRASVAQRAILALDGPPRSASPLVLAPLLAALAPGTDAVSSLVAAAVSRRCLPGSAGEADGVALALRWLHVCAARWWTVPAAGEGERAPPAAESQARYAALWTSFLDGLRSRLIGRARRAAGEVLRLAPLLPPAATVSWLRACCTAEPTTNADNKDADPTKAEAVTEWTTRALLAAREVAVGRPADRSWALRFLFEQATSENDDARAKATKLLGNRLWTEPTLRDAVEAAASKGLDDATAEVREGDETREGEGDLQPSEPSASSSAALRGPRAAQLFVALAARAPRLLPRLISSFGRAPDAVKQAVLDSAPDLARALGASSPSLLAAAASETSRDHPGSEPLCLRMLHAVAESSKPPALLLTVLESRADDARFRAVALPFGDDDKAALAAAPSLAPALPLGDLRVLCARLCTPGSSRPNGPLLRASELLVALHQDGVNKGDNNAQGVRAQVECLTRCLRDATLRRVFDRAAVTEAVQRLLARRPPPRLFLRTVMLAHQADPRLLGLTATVLDALSSRRVWEDPDHWRGFVLCCSHAAPHSFKFLLALPPAKLEEALGLQPALAGPLARHVAGMRPGPPRATAQAVERAQEPARRALAAKRPAAPAVAGEPVGAPVEPAAKRAAVEPTVEPAAALAASVPVPAARRGPPVRKPLPADAPRIEGTMAVEFEDSDDSD